MKKKELAVQLLSEVEKLFPEATTELVNWRDDFQFLVAVILSAQTTDIQVNKITPELFRKYPDAKKLASAKIEDLEYTLGGINYFRTKSKNIKKMAKILVEQYEGQPPKSLKKLIELPGVGYKTANVFLNERYRANEGIAVDTHVLRVARAYGLTKNTDPTKVAHDLEKLYPKKDWYKVNSAFVLYGRYILKARKPDMDRVVLKEYLV
ncbi:endonuclease III [Candidatus Dojkabacteria bacterium]|nr:endonuclease III [Candidatus Dojkabacteria bacterium]